MKQSLVDRIENYLRTKKDFICGGEIKKLRKTKNLIKTKAGYKLSRSAKEWAVSQLKLSREFPKSQTSKPTLSFDTLHPLIKKVSKNLFEDGYYSQAIFEAFKKVNNLVKEKSGRRDLDGKNLMLTTFSVNAPILKINNLISQTDKDEQE